MKKNLLIIIIAMVAVMSACTKEVLVQAPNGSIITIVPKQIDISIVGGKATVGLGDTSIYVQQNAAITLKIIASNTTLTGQSWKFYDDGSTSTGELITHTFATSSSKSYVKVTGVNSSGKTIEVTRTIFVVPNVSYYWGVQNLSLTKNADNSFSMTLAFNKIGMNSYRGKQYAYIGNITDVPWSGQVLIAPADTNYSVSNGVATAVTNGYGNWIIVRLTLKSYGFQYNMGLGKINGTTLNWSPFSGPFVKQDNLTLVGWNITNDSANNLLLNF